MEVFGEITMIENGIYGYAEATKNKLLVSSCDDDILFKYLPQGAEEDLTGDIEVKYTEGFVSGTTINKGLNFITTRACNIPNGTGIQTWDGSSWRNCVIGSCNNGYHQEGNSCVVDSSSGGGTPPTTPTTTTEGDINGDNKVDKYDFALMMAAWGQTGSNNSDLNKDGKVNKYDFALLMLYWTVV